MKHSEILLPLDKVIATAFKAFKVLNFSDQQAFDVTRQLMYGEIRGGKRNHALDRFLWKIWKNLGNFLEKIKKD